MTHTLSQSLGRCVNFGGICALLLLGLKVVERISPACVFLMRRNYPHISKIERKTFGYLLTKFSAFLSVFPFPSPKWAVELILSLSHPSYVMFYSPSIILPFPPFSVSCPLPSPLLFLSASRIVTEGIGLFTFSTW